ncbi:hypothetical protein ANN_22026 [Periplaneta americana]|uniref:Uncharacterized protein n=1 Tax=Periplaneta americana TaxID=6978 RepID=A0ABQ8S6Z7_PERAM|nr:hypothetical protein ANN_22026 [Periplaneta americana]
MACLCEDGNEPPGSLKASLLLYHFKVCRGSLYAVMWLADEPREFNLPTLPQRCITYEAEKLPSKYGVHSEEHHDLRQFPCKVCIEDKPHVFYPVDYGRQLTNYLWSGTTEEKNGGTVGKESTIYQSVDKLRGSLTIVDGRSGVTQTQEMHNL